MTTQEKIDTMKDRIKSDLLDGEKVYPIYELHFQWDQDDYKKNSTGSSDMLDEPIEDPIAYLTKRWEEIKQDKTSNADHLSELNPVLLSASIKRKFDDTWVVGWFNHSSRNVHLSDEDLLTSFQRFVNRNIENDYSYYGSYERYELRVSESLRICLMGAQDRWRWSDICRCEHCVGFGIVRINH